MLHARQPRACCSSAGHICIFVATEAGKPAYIDRLTSVLITWAATPLPANVSVRFVLSAHGLSQLFNLSSQTRRIASTRARAATLLAKAMPFPPHVPQLTAALRNEQLVVLDDSTRDFERHRYADAAGVASSTTAGATSPSRRALAMVSLKPKLKVRSEGLAATASSGATWGRLRVPKPQRLRVVRGVVRGVSAAGSHAPPRGAVAPMRDVDAVSQSGLPPSGSMRVWNYKIAQPTHTTCN